MKTALRHKLSQLVMAIILFFFIISVSVTFTLNFRPLYYADISFLGISETTGRSYEDIKANYDALIDYNQLFNSEALSFPSCAISETGRIHFEEVKDIFDIFGWMAIITAILMIISVIYARYIHRWLWLKLAAAISVILPVIAGVMIAANWEWVFITFHHMAFDNDYWIFDESTDPIITLLPDEFFMHCAIMIFALILVFSIISFVTGYKLSRSAKTQITHNN